VGELRKDYFRERYVIVSPERAKRPHDFIKPVAPLPKATPFAPENEHLLPPITAQYPANSDASSWQFRVIPNRFPIVTPEKNEHITPRTDNELFTWADAWGYHEIVIEGRADAVPFASLGVDGITEAITIAMERVRALHAQNSVAAVAYFKNEGLEAGASIAHPHSQIIATAIVPPSVQQLTEQHKHARTIHGFSPLYAVLDKERGGPRMVRESTHFAALCPYASRYPMEVLLIPLRDTNTYMTLSDEERRDLAEHLYALLEKLASIGAPYNIEWIHAPNTALHWHLSITPRLSTWAGYEIETNIIVNPVAPEHAAAFYRA